MDLLSVGSAVRANEESHLALSTLLSVVVVALCLLSVVVVALCLLSVVALVVLVVVGLEGLLFNLKFAAGNSH